MRARRVARPALVPEPPPGYAPPVTDAPAPGIQVRPPPRGTVRVVSSLIALVLAPLSWFWSIDDAVLRASGIAVWMLFAAALFLSLSAAWRDRRGWVRGVAVFELAVVGTSVWAFFGLASLPEGAPPAQAPDFTLPDQDGRPVTLSEELARGPVLLVFYRGHWCPTCRSELRGLVEADAAMKVQGGTLLAISADELEDLASLRTELELPFRLLSAAGLPTLADYGLEHAEGGPNGETIAVPAELLVGQDGRIGWRHVAERIQDRATPRQVLAAIARLPAVR
jgi:peroxiredoxin